MVDMYINGVNEGSLTQVVASITSSQGITHTQPTIISANDSTGGSYFDGNLDQILVYSKALSQSNITALYGSGSGTSTPDTVDLVAHYNFEQTGSTLENQGFLSQATTDNSPNTLTVTANAGTTTTGVISNAISAPDLEVTSSLLPDGTDSFTVGSWVKQTATPTDTKLLGFNDVTFNVGTTTADFVYTTYSQPTTYSQLLDNDWTAMYSSAQKWGGIELQTTNANGVGDYLDDISFWVYKFGSPTGNIYAYVLDSNNNVKATSTNYVDISTLGTASTGTKFTWTFDGTYQLQAGNKIVIEHATGNNQNYLLARISTTSTYDSSDTRFCLWQSGWNCIDSRDFKFTLNEIPQATPTTIISATGLTDNTSDFQHYALTRDGSSWTLYQNGASVATATDSTDLGTVSGSHKINIDGVIDEYFIDSTALTSAEIDNAYDRKGTFTFLTNPNQATYAQVPLPDNGGADAGSTGDEVDFTDNELLIHEMSTSYSANSNLDATAHETITWSTDVPSVGGSYSMQLSSPYNGGTQGISTYLSNGGATIGTDGFTIGAWVKRSGTQGDGQIVQVSTEDHSNGGNPSINSNSRHSLYYWSSNALRAVTIDSAGSQNTQGSSFGGSWVQVLLVRESGSGSVVSYLDGTQNTSYSAGASYNAPDLFTVGGLGANLNEGGWIGNIDEAFYLDRPVTSAEITALQTQSVEDVLNGDTDLIVYYDFEQTSGNPINRALQASLTVSDSSPNNLSVTTNAGTTTTGQLSNAISAPDLSVTSSLLPDGTDSFTVGSWVKQSQTRDSTLDGTKAGATVSTSTGKVGTNAWDFSGTGTVDFTAKHNIHQNSQYSVSFWLNVDNYVNNGIIFDDTDFSSGNVGLGCRTESTGQIYCAEFYGSAGFNYWSLMSTTGASTGSWYHYVITVDSGNVATMYRNGQSVATDTSFGTKNTNPSTYNFRMGDGANGNDNNYDGKIDQLVMYDRILSGTEISDLYSSGSGTTTVPTNGLVDHWDFEQTGSTLENQIFIPPTNTELLGFTNSNGNLGRFT
jgi:hypothetical protein